MSRYFSYTITESGRKSTIKYTRRTLQESLVPLSHAIKQHYAKSKERPYILAVAGPPGSGKSALSSLLEIFLEELGTETHVLPLDGFHYKDEELKKMKAYWKGRTLALYERKGAKETYRIERLIDLMKALKSGESLYWPLYSRSTHSPVENGIFIEKPDALYIIEGNYLLLDCEPWNSIRKYFDEKIFIASKKRFLRRRIIRRKKRGGFSRSYARRHYRSCDAGNIDEVLDFSSGYDYLLMQRGAHRYTLHSL